MFKKTVFPGLCLVATMVFATACGDDEGDAATPPPNCASSGTPAFATYGTAAFVAVNESIVSNVVTQTGGDLESPELGSSFTRIANRVPEFKGNLAAFLVRAYGGPDSITYTDGVSYDGDQDMTRAHTGLAITSAQYDFFVTSIVVPALSSNGVPQGDIASCFAPVVTDAAFKASMVGK